MLCLLAIPALAQQAKLTVTPPSAITVPAGGSADAVVRVSILPGNHVNSNKPKDEFLIPLKLTFDPKPGFRIGDTTYPPAEDVQVGDSKLSVFTGTFDLKTPVHAEEGAKAGSVELTGKLRYQACNDRMCFPPKNVEIKVPVTIQPK